MFLMNSSQRENKTNKEYTHKLIKDIFKIGLMVVGLKVAAAVINRKWLYISILIFVYSSLYTLCPMHLCVCMCSAAPGYYARYLVVEGLWFNLIMVFNVEF